MVDAIGEPVNLLGHSYGGICALEAAMRTRSVRTLVLYEPPIPVGLEIVPAETRARIEALIAAGEREEALVTFFREVVQTPEPQLERLRAHEAWEARVAAAHTVSREIAIEDVYRMDFDALRAIETPTLLLLGGESPRYMTEATRRLNETLPNSRIHVIPGQQHAAMDLVPEEFVAAVHEFISVGRR